MLNRIMGWAVLVWGLAAPARGQVVINEVCAENTSIVSAAGTLPDYVELYNTGTSSVALAGWTLTDDVTKPAKWAFPSGTTIGAKSNLVVWLDSTNNYTPLVSTNFSLRASGEEVVLFQGSNQRDHVRFGPQIKNRTVSRYPSGSTNWVLGLQTPGTTNIMVQLGTPMALRINEIMATNSLGDDWVELYNPATNLPVAIGSMVLIDTNNLSGHPSLWPNGFIDTDGFVLFSCTGDTNRGDHVVFKLSSSLGETLYLYASNRVTLIDTVTFGPQQGDVSYGRLPDGGTNFFYFSPTNFVSPGSANDWQPLNSVVVNEVLTHTDLPMEDAIELLNVTDAPVDISYWWLSNSRNLPLKFRIPAGTILPARGYKVFYEQKGSGTAGFNRSSTGVFPDFTFNSAHGDEVVITVGSSNVAVTGARSVRDLPAGANAVSLGRYVKNSGGTDFVPQSRRSFGHDAPPTVADFRLGTGLSNSYPLVGPIIFSEIMYHPVDVVAGGVTNDNSLDEYIELKNITNAPVKLYDAAYPTNTWHLEGGVSFTFPTNITVASTSVILIVNFDPKTNLTQLAAFRSKYGVPANTPFFGPYSGKLNNKTDTLELYKPDPVQLAPHPDAGFVPSILVEKLKYEDNDPWPAGADNTGQSLQRISHTGYSNDETNWFAGPATPGNPTIPELPPIITIQPRDVLVLPGGDAVFTVKAIGTPVLTYQWYWNGLELPGGDTSTFSISGVESFYEGGYYVVLNNSVGTTVSVTANLRILTPPLIVDEPISQVVTQGTRTVIDVTATGTEPLTYKWFFGTNLLSNVTGPMLIISNTQVTNGGNYHVIITNAAGQDVSTTATVTVGLPPTVVTQPVSQFVGVGTNVNLVVSATGTSPMSYQWRKDGVSIPGATSSTLALSNVQTNQTGLYAAVVSNGFGMRTSIVAVVSIAGPPHLLSATRLTNGVMQVVLDGLSGHVYELLGTTNFNGWSVIKRLTNTSDRQLILDTSATNAPHRFYRGRLVQ
jgi:hypothetical protein